MVEMSQRGSVDVFSLVWSEQGNLIMMAHFLMTTDIHTYTHTHTGAGVEGHLAGPPHTHTHAPQQRRASVFTPATVNLVRLCSDW